jgi:NhaA family Na+:H+ antiporter
MQHSLSPWVTFFVIPIFAFSNAGIDFTTVQLGEALRNPVALGVILGLVLGKFTGISCSCWFAVKLGIARLPAGVGWRHILGVAWLAGIGFTMSLFISQLAFDNPIIAERAKIGILVASLVAGLIGFAWLLAGGRRMVPNEADSTPQA